jgi:hypothetical protein
LAESPLQSRAEAEEEEIFPIILKFFKHKNLQFGAVTNFIFNSPEYKGDDHKILQW